ncbi:MAG: vitamin B12 dependent methionine synthase [Eggerthellaceae bacterium]|nr:vitamin B12 dependent methionine synthase [Eggerthellaceae bacterium]
MGMSDGGESQEVDDALRQRIEDSFTHCEECSTPAWTYRVFPLQETDEGLALVGTVLVLTGDDIRTHLHGAKYCAVMAATCGLANERELQIQSAKGTVEALAFDAAGSALAETTASACNAAIVEDAHEQGLFCNWRYSPGYGDLPLSLQPQILRILEAEKLLGITTTPAHLMVPTKSVTALVGLFDQPQEQRKSCQGCSLFQECTLRTKGHTCYQ